MAEGDLKTLLLRLTSSTLQEHSVGFLVLRKLKGNTYMRLGHAWLRTAFSTEETVATVKKTQWVDTVIG